MDHLSDHVKKLVEKWYAPDKAQRIDRLEPF